MGDKTTVKMDKKLVKRAHELGFNVSRVCENALKDAIDAMESTSKKSIFKDSKGSINLGVQKLDPSTDSVFKLLSADHNVQVRHGQLHTTTGVDMEIVGKITIYSAGFGVLAGAISGGLSIAGISAGAGLLIALIFIVVLVYKLIPFALGAPKPAAPAASPTPARPPTEPQVQQLPDRRKIFTNSFWPFVVMWLLLWVLVYTLFV
jgi:hypothetical protein